MTDLIPFDDDYDKLPDEWKADKGEGLEEIRKDFAEYLRPPMLKFVGDRSNENFKSKFNKGSVIVAPQGTVVIEGKINEQGNIDYKACEPFFFTPIGFYVEWVCWNPYTLFQQRKVPAIVEKSFDIKSELAQRAMDPSSREEDFQFDGKTYQRTYQEHLNFFILIHDRGVSGPVIMSCARTRHKYGRNFMNMLHSDVRPAPMYARIYVAKLVEDTNPQGSWSALEINNPGKDDPKFISIGDYPSYKQMHNQFQELKEQIAANYEVDDVDNGENDLTATI